MRILFDHGDCVQVLCDCGCVFTADACTEENVKSVRGVNYPQCPSCGAVNTREEG